MNSSYGFNYHLQCDDFQTSTQNFSPELQMQLTVGHCSCISGCSTPVCISIHTPNSSTALFLYFLSWLKCSHWKIMLEEINSQNYLSFSPIFHFFFYFIKNKKSLSYITVVSIMMLKSLSLSPSSIQPLLCEPPVAVMWASEAVFWQVFLLLLWRLGDLSWLKWPSMHSFTVKVTGRTSWTHSRQLVMLCSVPPTECLVLH